MDTVISDGLDLDDNLFEKLLGNLPDSVLLLDSEDKILYANHYAIEFMQRGDKSLVGQHFGTPVTEMESTQVEIITKKGLRLAELRVSETVVDDQNLKLVSLRDVTEAVESQKQYEDMMRSTVEALSRAVEVRDPYTSGHQSRVAQISVAIADKIGATEGFKKGLYFAGVLHDIGKIAIPAAILTKPGHLEPEEMALIRLHTRVGFRIVQGINFPWPVADILRQHHERLDGSGYPDGLKGEEIYLEAQILGVADTVDAMLADRPYRKPKGMKDTLKALQESSGKTLNAELCKVCTEMLESGELNFWD